jgi:hypothetical protein
MLSFVCCGTYTNSQIVSQEMHVLSILSFSLGHPTAETFLKRLVRMNNHVFLQAESRSLARFILECSLVSPSFIGIRASWIAQASLLLAYQITVCLDMDLQLLEQPPGMESRQRYRGSTNCAFDCSLRCSRSHHQEVCCDGALLCK